MNAMSVNRTGFPLVLRPGPGLKHEEAPQEPLVVPESRQMLSPGEANGVGLKEALLDEPLFFEEILGPFAQGAAKPITQGYTEARLGSLRKLSGNVSRQEVSQDSLAATSIHQHRLWQAPGQLHDLGIQERAPDFEPAGHAGPVDLDQNAIR